MISDECSFEDYEEFFKAYDEFDKKEEERKKRSNDYNPLLVIRSMSDEVGLHSRFLHSVLDTGGLHYQKGLFLRLFLKCLGLEDFFKDTNLVRVQREYKNIDLYLNDGINHLIIENKIYAGDGKEQISTYINKIKEEGVEYENIAVVYLSLEVKEEEDLKYSLGKWKIVDKEGNQKTLERLNEKGEREGIYSFKNATYKEEILKWIEKCQKECKNISNLYMSFEFYKECVKILIEGEKMGIKQFLEENKDKREKFIKIVAKIQKQRAEELSVEMFRQECAEKYKSQGYELLEEKEYQPIGSKIWEKRIICHKNHSKSESEQTFKYVLTLERTSFNRSIGFRLYDEGWKKDGKDEIVKKLKKIIEKSPNIENIKINQWGWWLANEKGETDLVDLSNESLEEYFEKRYKKVELLNDFLKTNPDIQKLAKELEQNNSTQGSES